ncbi:hypothetical protein bthur0003_58150 [Bacillus thuringiensis serovar thuringiensis str. T01001]|uniref:Uncharacterized protein n=1 Tax=Bacillus thuringiensis T01-328 TaxID=1324966 RepID=A0AAN4KLD4_BACTU|nr:hypothetical protein H175_328p264 [Bacillus thuringiensis serovar thuringiensis str. IS5056]EEM31687.1 hypothetical protein bthur0003_58150 [Bacillus thuringiensis serovar thuringiensis str. T01001]EEM66290.1 hypothetical protein bthur0008_20690 [Bacillus thuringiensis serovar berliner ATCC 10792]ERH96648.1 hypothetical protein BTCBT_007213 [Bacillus thuringiensis T01-328]
MAINLRKVITLKMKKRADFLRELTVENENFHLGGTSKS